VQASIDAGANARTVEHRPATIARRRLAGDSGVWLFICADVFAFALFFALFTWGRIHHTELYEESRRALDARFGVANTLILLTSSLFMVLSVEATRASARRAAVRYLALTMLVGSTFAITKVLEYKSKISAGITMLTNEFFTYYFVFTGIHFLHFAIGMVALAVTLSKLKTQELDGRLRVWVESCGCYWHMVDLLWIMLFPLLYLQR
jgi:nitric oxide reductase NorE protein